MFWQWCKGRQKELLAKNRVRQLWYTKGEMSRPEMPVLDLFVFIHDRISFANCSTKPNHLAPLASSKDFKDLCVWVCVKIISTHGFCKRQAPHREDSNNLRIHAKRIHFLFKRALYTAVGFSQSRCIFVCFAASVCPNKPTTW